jgi:DNA-binding cell septation regulator SpoVG
VSVYISIFKALALPIPIFSQKSCNQKKEALSMSNAVESKLDVRTYPIIEPKNNVMAYASVTIDDKIAINGIRVVDGSNGLFAQMPQTRDSKGDFRDVAFPVTKELRLQLNEAIVNQYALDISSVMNQLKDRQAAVNKSPAKDTPALENGKPPKNKTGPEH